MYISIQQYKDNVVTLTFTGRILQSMHRFEDLSDCIHVHEFLLAKKTHQQIMGYIAHLKKQAQIKKYTTALYH